MILHWLWYHDLNIYRIINSDVQDVWLKNRVSMILNWLSYHDLNI